MTDKGLKYLYDIFMSISLIKEITKDVADFNAYESDRKTQSAVERQLAIIGEALNNFKKVEPTIEIQSAKQIVAFRNRLVHAYDGIDNSIVWVILNQHLNPLKLEVIKLSE